MSKATIYPDLGLFGDDQECEVHYYYWPEKHDEPEYWNISKLIHKRTGMDVTALLGAQGYEDVIEMIKGAV